MAQRRHHYERAFEHYLRATRVPYVAVDEARKALLPSGARLERPGSGGPPGALKSFDFVVYGEGSNLLLEIKGRKVARRRAGAGGGRLECWVGRDDVESLGVWEGLFGPGFEAAFVFVYWCEDQPPDGLFQEVFAYQDRWYALRSITLEAYARSMRTRSPRWGTVDLPTEAFGRLSHPFAPGRGWRGGVGDAGPGVAALEPLGRA